MTSVSGTPPKCQKAFSMQRIKSSVVWRNVASLYALREWDNTMRKTCVLRRLPSGPMTGAPVPKSTWASTPGAHSRRRMGSTRRAPSFRTNRLTLS